MSVQSIRRSLLEFAAAAKSKKQNLLQVYADQQAILNTNRYTTLELEILEFNVFSGMLTYASGLCTMVLGASAGSVGVLLIGIALAVVGGLVAVVSLYALNNTADHIRKAQLSSRTAYLGATFASAKESFFGGLASVLDKIQPTTCDEPIAMGDRPSSLNCDGSSI